MLLCLNTCAESDKSDEEELVPVTFTAKVIPEGLALGRKLGNHFIQNDTNVERSLRFQRDINRCLSQYEKVYKNVTKNSKQLLITDFITTSQNVNISASNIDRHKYLRVMKVNSNLRFRKKE